MELDGDALKQDPFKECRMISMPAFVRTLRIPGNFDWRRAIHTILVHYKMTMLLPVADLAVRKHHTEGGDDPFKPVGGAPLPLHVLACPCLLASAACPGKLTSERVVHIAAIHEQR